MEGGVAPESGSALGASTMGTKLSLDEVFSRIGVGFFHYRLLFVCGFGFSAAAVELVLTSFLLEELRIHWKLDEGSLGLIPVIGSCGSLAGELLFGVLADFYGRRPVFMITVLLVVTFGIGSAFSQNIMTLLILRCFVGFGLGGNIAVDFTMFSEFLPTTERGQMLFYMAAFWTFGQVGTCALAWLVIPRFGWRGFLIVGALPSLLTSFLRPLIPESPRWLLLSGQEEEAMQVCREVALCNGVKPEDMGLREGVKLSLENAATSLMGESGQKEERAKAFPFFVLFSWPFRRTTGALTFLVAGLSFAGYATTTFLPSFLELRGIRHESLYEVTLLTAIAQLPGLIAAGICSTIFGRKLPLQFVLLAVAAALAFFAKATTLSHVTVSMSFASAFLEFGWALFHVYTPEAYPTELRASATGFIEALGSVSAMAAPLACAWLIEGHASEKQVILHLCGCIGSCGILAAVLFHYETHGEDLTDFASQLDRRLSGQDHLNGIRKKFSSSDAA